MRGRALDRRQRAALFVVGLVLGVLVLQGAVVLAGYLDDSYSATSGVTYGASDSGPKVTLGMNTVVQSGNPATDAQTLELKTQAGNATFSSSGSTNAQIDQFEGTWTNVSNLDVSGAELTVDPDDKAAFSVSGDTDSLAVRNSFATDDDTVDFVYAGASGTSTVTLRGVDADTQIAAVDRDTNTILDISTSDSNGEITFSSMSNSEHNVELQTTDGGPSLTNPSPQGKQSTAPTTLSVDVSDADFPDDEVTVEFFLDGTSVGTDTLTSAGTASVSISAPSGGEHTVRAEAVDEYGQTNKRDWTFSIANELVVRDAQDPWAKIDDREVTFTFYEGDDIFEASTSTSVLDLQGLPVDGRIVAQVETSGYQTSFVVLEDITEQNTVYMLADTATTVEVRFTLDDNTGGLFESNNPELFIQKPINRTGPNPEWKTIHADQFGVEGVTTDLEDGQRYRLIIKNDQGDTRMLGTYTADTSETVPLRVGSVSAVPEDQDAEFMTNASYVNNTAGEFVRFEFNDTSDDTDQVVVQIHERNNPSNVLFSNTTFGGPLGTIALLEEVPEDQRDNDWVVKAWVTKGGETTQITIPVGPQRPLLQEMPEWLRAMMSVGAIIIVGGLFSQLNGDVGALVVAGMGGMFWFVDFLPSATGFGVVLLSMMTAAVIFINGRRGGGL